MKYLPNKNTELFSVAADRNALAEGKDAAQDHVEPRYISVEDKQEKPTPPPVTSKA